jgi:hypothetical protein
MKKSIEIFIFFILTVISSTLKADEFTACDSTYALCTTARCVPIEGSKDLVSCNCKVKSGYSAGTKPCHKIVKTQEGDLIYSRYFPIKSYVTCSNSRPWAWCLDKPCLIDKKDFSKASCACSLVKNLGDYIIVADSYSQSVCTTDIVSSATVTDANKVTDFLKTQKELQPYPVKVISP